MKSLEKLNLSLLSKLDMKLDENINKLNLEV